MQRGKWLLFAVVFTLAAAMFIPAAEAQVTCGSTCVTAAQVATETANNGKCLFIYNSQVYQPPSGTISNRMHKNEHSCGADVTGIMKQSHLNNPNHYLIPYVCAPLCSGPAPCQDADGDGYTAASCGGTDCNDNNAAIRPGATETCNNVDDNCNAQIDESLTRQQSCGIGACAVTMTQTCSAGNYGPSCSPGTPSAEVCGNSADEDCDGALNNGCSCTPASTQACGTDTGACQAGTQTCSAQGTWGSCTGSIQPIAEICGNSLDDDCDGTADDGCGGTPQTTPPPATGNASTPSPISIPPPSVCTPQCAEKCGQDNGCRGKCPNDDKYAVGKCGNPSCVPACAGNSCGQDNGCGGICPDLDKNTCGLCGNAPCCIPEICKDEIDNDCDGNIDDGCGKLGTFFTTLVGQGTNEQLSPLLSQDEKEAQVTVAILKKPSFLARVTGIAAFFFAGLTLLVGLYRVKMIEKYSRKQVIRFHAILGSLAILFVLFHITSVLLDVGGWADTVKFVNVIFPDFNGLILFDVSLGVVGFYFFLVTIITGALFTRMAKRFGYPTWMFFHRFSFIFYIFIFFHAIRIGTDFRNPYVTIFFMHVLILVAYQIFFKVLKPKEDLKKLKMVYERIMKRRFDVKELLERQELVGREIITSGDLVKVEKTADKRNWWKLTNGESQIYALLKQDAEPETYTRIKGILMKTKSSVYIDVSEAVK